VALVPVLRALALPRGGLFLVAKVCASAHLDNIKRACSDAKCNGIQMNSSGAERRATFLTDTNEGDLSTLSEPPSISRKKRLGYAVITPAPASNIIAI